jgi:hypothetical protein
LIGKYGTIQRIVEARIAEVATLETSDTPNAGYPGLIGNSYTWLSDTSHIQAGNLL